MAQGTLLQQVSSCFKAQLPRTLVKTCVKSAFRCIPAQAMCRIGEREAHPEFKDAANDALCCRGGSQFSRDFHCDATVGPLAARSLQSVASTLSG